MKKKNLLLSMCLLVSMVVCANPYEHSVGISMGGFNGLSYKLWKSNNFAFQFDIGIQASVGATSGTPKLPYKKTNFYVSSYSASWQNLTLEAVPTFLFQKSVFSNHICEIAPYVGGGVSLGYLCPRDMYVYAYKNDEGFPMFAYDGLGKFGVHTALGVEFAFLKNMSLSVDFKPGYGLGFGSVEGKYHEYYSSSYYDRYSYYSTNAYASILLNYFDWSLSMAMRFYL